MKTLMAWLLPFCGALVLLLAASPGVQGDEGMWLFSNPPKRLLKEKYGFEADNAWLEHLQRSSVRFNSGGSGSFVSSEGLALTNHHIGEDSIQKLSTPEKNYMLHGFYAKTRAEELKCPDMELNVLQGIEDVTARIDAAVKRGASLAEAEKARRAAMNTIEQESTEKTGLRSDVVTLYRGAVYHLYRYKKYTDVRLVFAPEQSVAFFGGDPDNFEYPRYDLDICLFRVYENDKPARIEHYLKWSHEGAGDGELVFVSGHPGRTDRLDTLAHLEYLRDISLPDMLRQIYRREVLLRSYSERSGENARRAQRDLFGIQNSRKALVGQLAGLQDPWIMARKAAAEYSLREKVGSPPEVFEAGHPPPAARSTWSQVAAALRTLKKIQIDLSLLEHADAFRSQLFTIARTLVRLAEEGQKPNAERLREFRQSNLESVRQALFSPAPIYDDLETVKLADSLSYYVERAGAADELVEKVLARKSPRERAAELVRGTTLRDVAVRRKLAEGGLAAIEASSDPMIRLARQVDDPARKVRRTFEEEV
ncbi:MAG: S46 family peptidase, partial [Thermoguttaceae bacterium]